MLRHMFDQILSSPSSVPHASVSSACQLRSDCGVVIELDIERFVGKASAPERRFLARIAGPVLDIGCGPGRAAAFLREHGTVALGLDSNPGLIDLARSNGALCVRQSIFDPVPFEGRWHDVLLLDGNIGIGGDPVKLLDRLHAIVEPRGRAFLEIDAAGPTRLLTVREHDSDSIGDPFAWATVSIEGIEELLVGSGWTCHDVHTIDDADQTGLAPSLRSDRVVVELEHT